MHHCIRNPSLPSEKLSSSMREGIILSNFPFSIGMHCHTTKMFCCAQSLILFHKGASSHQKSFSSIRKAYVCHPIRSQSLLGLLTKPSHFLAAPSQSSIAHFPSYVLSTLTVVFPFIVWQTYFFEWLQ
jgi:hypothetical protein